MSKPENLVDAIATLLDTPVGQRLRIGVIIRGNVGLAQRVADSGNKVVIVGDSFRPLFRIWKRTRSKRGRVLLVEARPEEIPIAKRSLDVLILERVPRGDAALVRQRLEFVRGFLKPGGRLMWVHRIRDGFWWKVFGGKGSGGLRWRHQMCALSMECGLAEVGQKVVRKSGPGRYALTMGTRTVIPA